MALVPNVVSSHHELPREGTPKAYHIFIEEKQGSQLQDAEA
jgi:hypothetical protein